MPITLSLIVAVFFLVGASGLIGHMVGWRMTVLTKAEWDRVESPTVFWNFMGRSNPVEIFLMSFAVLPMALILKRKLVLDEKIHPIESFFYNVFSIVALLLIFAGYSLYSNMLT